MKLPLALLALLAACAHAGPGTVSEIVGQALEVARLESLDSAPAQVDNGGYRELVHTHDSAQGVEFRPGDDQLTLVTMERAVGSERFDRTSTTLDAGFAIEAIAARQANEVFVAGVESDGAVVIQRWLVDPRPNGTGREDVLTVRATVLRTHEIADVRSMIVDPDGRYVVALAGDGERLLQVSAHPNGVVLASFEAGRLPALRSACGIFVGEHVGGSRVIAFEASGIEGVERAVFVDRDRDGTFDEVFDGTADTWAANGFQGSVWTAQTFVTGR